MLKPILKGIITIIFLLKTATVIAQSPIIELSPETSNYDIGTSTTYYEDKTERLKIEHILSSEIDKQFVVSKNEALVFGITTSSFWVKITARNKKPLQLSRWILTVDYPPLDYISLYQKDKTGKWISQELGDRLPFTSRAIPHYKFAFVLSMPDTSLHTFYLKVRNGGSVVIGPHIESEKYFVEDSQIGSIGYGFFMGALVIMFFYNLFLYFSLKDISYLAYVCFIFINLLCQLCYSGHISQYLFPDNPLMANKMLPISVALTPMAISFFTITFLNTRKFTPILHKILLLIGVIAFINFLISVFFTAHVAGYGNGVNISFSLVIVIIAGVVNLIKGNQSARFFLLAWSFVAVGGAIITLKSFGVHFPNFIARNGSMISALIEIVMLSIALADKYNLFKKEKESAQLEILKLNENATKVLEQKVTERTAELNYSLARLKTTQNQLIQREKLASLGELTSGIAHEIQNPLNFVNNFSEVSRELIDELEEELKAGNPDIAFEIATDLKENLSKINQHGNRASDIVKGMLEHSRNNTGEPISSDINALVEEYLRLSYNGYKTKNKDFNVELVKSFDENLPKLELIPQDIGRVLVNIINNAFHAIASVNNNERENGYIPTLAISTLKSTDKVRILIKDNGIGIAEKVKHKIFEPFFTTKPTGQGVGLGLSLAHDIIAKGHGGTIDVESQEGIGTTFIIELPI